MKDIVKWAVRMRRIGIYKKRESERWHRTVSLHQRIKMMEELLCLKDNYTRHTSLISFLSLSKALEQKYVSKK